MAKVLLVEDDNNLREIFEMRVQAEGYDTVVAGDGEEGLVVAMKEKPDLIVADVMMPKLSGFEMLETLRAAPEMVNTKVIMMTALGQAEDQARGEKLGVVKYLVKSQVTLEDFARVIKEVLGSPKGSAPVNGTELKKDEPQNNKENGNKEESEKTMPEDTTPPTNPAPADPAAPADDAPAANPISDTPAVDGQQSSAQEQNAVNDQVNSFVSNPAPADPAAPATDASAAPTEHADVPVAEPPADSGAPAAPADPAAPAGDSSAPPSGL